MLRVAKLARTSRASGRDCHFRPATRGELWEQVGAGPRSNHFNMRVSFRNKTPPLADRFPRGRLVIGEEAAIVREIYAQTMSSPVVVHRLSAQTERPEKATAAFPLAADGHLDFVVGRCQSASPDDWPVARKARARLLHFCRGYWMRFAVRRG